MRGLSLIELVVVVAVLSVLAVSVTISFGRPAPAGGFARAHAHHADLALFSGTPRALELSPGGWRALVLTSAGWAPAGAGALSAGAWQAPELWLEGRPAALLPPADPPRPDVLLLPDLRSTPLEVVEGGRRCASDGAAPLVCA